jgi:hypothetical protein
MVPQPSRTGTNKHHPTALTCDISKNRRSGRDRNNLDTVVIIRDLNRDIEIMVLRQQLTMPGSGTCSTCPSRFPCHVNAFTALSPPVAAPVRHRYPSYPSPLEQTRSPSHERPGRRPTVRIKECRLGPQLDPKTDWPCMWVP